MSSSATTALSRQPLAEVLQNVDDPRDRRGVRHSLFTVLSLAITGVMAGSRSLTAIWEYTTDLTATDLAALGLEAGQALPSESTIRRVLKDLDPADLNTQFEVLVLYIRTGTVAGRRVIAARRQDHAWGPHRQGPGASSPLSPGSRHRHGPDPGAGGDKTNEVPALRELLEPLDLDGAVVTADAMHTQVDTAQ